MSSINPTIRISPFSTLEGLSVTPLYSQAVYVVEDAAYNHVVQLMPIVDKFLFRNFGKTC